MLPLVCLNLQRTDDIGGETYRAQQERLRKRLESHKTHEELVEEVQSQQKKLAKGFTTVAAAATVLSAGINLFPL